MTLPDHIRATWPASARALARKAGVSAPAVRRLMAGGEPSPATVRAIAIALGAEPGELAHWYALAFDGRPLPQRSERHRLEGALMRAATHDLYRLHGPVGDEYRRAFAEELARLEAMGGGQHVRAVLAAGAE